MTEPSTAMSDEELDELREHFVDGSGAYTDSALVGRLVCEIDRLRAEARASARPTVERDEHTFVWEGRTHCRCGLGEVAALDRAAAGDPTHE